MKYTHKQCFNAHQFAACNAFERTVFYISNGKWPNASYNWHGVTAEMTTSELKITNTVYTWQKLHYLNTKHMHNIYINANHDIKQYQINNNSQKLGNSSTHLHQSAASAFQELRQTSTVVVLCLSNLPALRFCPSSLSLYSSFSLSSPAAVLDHNQHPSTAHK